MTDTTSDVVGTSVADENLTSTAAAADANATPVENQEAESSTAADESSEKDSEKRVPWFQKRIDEITRDKYEERRAREAAERRAQEIEARLKELETKAPAQPDPADEPLKTAADFNYDDAAYARYLQQVIDQRAERRARDAASKFLQEERAREATERAIREYQSRVDDFKKTAPDFDDVVFHPSVAISQPMAEVIKRSEFGPAIAYQLGKNPELSTQIARLPPELAAYELGQIAASIKSARAAKAAPPPSVPKAPPPPPTLTTAGEPLKKTDDQMTDAEWAALRAKERLKQQRRK